RQLTDTLKALLVERKRETLQNGWGEVPSLVFVSEQGTMLDGDNIRHRAFLTVLKGAGLRRIRIHDLRHTFASLLIQNGESLAYVKEQMRRGLPKLCVNSSRQRCSWMMVFASV